MGYWNYVVLIWLNSFIFVSGVQNGWRPIKSKPDFVIGPRIIYGAKKIPLLQTCSLHKAVMDQHSFHQYIQYKHHIPDLKEFTLCAWHKLYNHSTNHPIFSYALPHKPRAILSWIMSTSKKSYYMLAVNNHVIYRINFPVQLHKWYHICQSWNGKTGEWQLWINVERVGRGYYNLMVGKPIKSGGTAISGQEQTEFGNIFNWKNKESSFQGEITLLQLYKAALSKGKAYSDHKHHHVHEWSHNGEPTDEEGNDEPTQDPGISELTTEHPFLENGQLKPRLPIHELLAKSRPKPTQNLELLSAFQSLSPTMHFKFEEPPLEFFDHNIKLFKRNNEDTTNVAHYSERSKRDVNETIAMTQKRFSRDYLQTTESRQTDINMLPKYVHAGIQEQNKRSLVLTDSYPSSLGLHFSSESSFPILYSELDGHNIVLDDPAAFFKNTIPETGEAKIEYEPAEWEVKKISEICSGCDEDPFKKANVLSWQETPKKLFAGAEYVPAIPKCHIF